MKDGAMPFARADAKVDLEIRPVANRSELKKFIYLPEKVHSNHHTWVPPLYVSEWQYFDRRKNPAFSYCDTLLLLAHRGKEVVGRIMGIVNHRYNDLREERTARYAYLETREEERTVHALLAAVEDWAREKGMTRIVGPYGFSDQDPEGFLIEGFEHRATIVTYCNFAWMVLCIPGNPGGGTDCSCAAGRCRGLGAGKRHDQDRWPIRFLGSGPGGISH